jgi:hypothetical protein
MCACDDKPFSWKRILPDLDLEKKGTIILDDGVLSFWNLEPVAEDRVPGQSELTATNAPVGRSVHWMGCVFSFGAGWGSW